MDGDAVFLNSGKRYLISIYASGPGGPERSRFWGSGMDEAKPTAAVNGVKPSLVLFGLSEASSPTPTPLGIKHLPDGGLGHFTGDGDGRRSARSRWIHG